MMSIVVLAMLAIVQAIEEPATNWATLLVLLAEVTVRFGRGKAIVSLRDYLGWNAFIVVSISVR